MTITNKQLTKGETHGRPGNAIKPEGIVIHYVGNPGSSALANRNYFENGAGGLGASAHYIIGLQGEVLQCVPENEQANHAGKSYGEQWNATAATANKKYIGIENCHPDSTGQFATLTYISLLELCADIFKRCGWGVDEIDKRVLRHYDVCGKLCPLYYVNSSGAWPVFKKELAAKIGGGVGATPTPTPKTPITGKSVLTAEQLNNYARKVNPDAPEYGAFYIAEGEAEGVRGDLAFCQSCLETNFWRFGGDVKAAQNNFAGLGATGGGVTGNAFKTPQEGIRAQIQHLKAYASEAPLVNPCVDPRFNNVVSAYGRGKNPNWEDLSGKWAADKEYAKKILAVYNAVVAFNPTATSTAAGTAAGTTAPQPAPATTVPIAPSPFKEYLVKITADTLNVRNGAGSRFDVVTTVVKGGVYTIVAESDGWGRLKSGAGWICLAFTAKQGVRQ